MIDIREPSLKQHETAMELGSKHLLTALRMQHPKLMRERTGQMVGPC